MVSITIYFMQYDYYGQVCPSCQPQEIILYGHGCLLLCLPICYCVMMLCVMFMAKEFCLYTLIIMNPCTNAFLFLQKQPMALAIKSGLDYYVLSPLVVPIAKNTLCGWASNRISQCFFVISQRIAAEKPCLKRQGRNFLVTPSNNQVPGLHVGGV